MIGTTLGPYEITAKLGEGGMGEVYRATDTKLKRDVAIKVLPAEFTEDRERLARFEREAQLLAQLHHPNIASIFGLEEGDGTRALVMELVEGPTLAERLESGALPLKESLLLARQIAEALEEAHEKGIIHRDLKPQNIKASMEGKIKVLDFGLAKAMDPTGTASGERGSGSQLAHSPTLTMGATVQGMILGTAAYMAPEQAKGLAVDKRADIWAFGVILWEMLIGGSLFAGDTVGDTLAAVIRAEIDLDRLPVGTPPALRRLLRRCLERNPKNRLHDIADARIVIDELLTGSKEEPEAAEMAPPARRPLARLLVVGAGVVVGLGLGVLLGRGVARAPSTAVAAPFVGQFEISAPAKTEFVSGLALSADGRRLAFVARGEDGRTHLWVRDLDAAEAKELPGTVDAMYPFWAPDGRRLGFFSQNRLKVTDLLGGSPRAVADTGSTFDARGGAWNADDRIVFAPTFTGPLFMVAASGGAVEPATAIEQGSRVGTHRFPSFLPDGKRFVFYASTGTGVEPGMLYLGRLGDLSTKELGPANSSALYVEPGFLIYVQGDSLVAQRFDGEREELSGTPAPLGITLPGSVSVSGQRSLAASQDGLLVYRADKRNASRLVLADRQGREVRNLTGEGGTWYYAPAVSPDGHRIAVTHYEPGSTSGSIWAHDLDRGLTTRLTFDETSDDIFSVWSPDGRQIAYVGVRGTGVEIDRIDSRNPGPPQPWVRSKSYLTPYAWRSGDQLLYAAFDAAGNGNLMMRSGGAEAEPRRVGPDHVSEPLGDLSPDGRWLAVQSNASRRMEVYLRRIDDRSGASTVRVSTDGGTMPRWRRDGRELFYLDEAGRLMSVTFASLDPLRPNPPVTLFDARLESAADRQYDVLPDGERFVLNRTLVSSSVPISVVIGWPARLRQDNSK